MTMAAALRGALIAFAVADLGAAQALAASAQVKTVYGTDNRREVGGLRGPLARDADATVALVQNFSVADKRNGYSELLGETLGSAYGLCPDQRFRAQPTAAFCSGVLVSTDTVVTAGHCVDAASLATTRFVFGYRVEAGRSRTTIRNADIYKGKKVIASIAKPAGTDYAIVRLDRPVTGHVPARLKSSGRVAKGRSIHVVGHPSGLPAKIAGGAEVQRVDTIRFISDLDTFAGNSGSPVFDSLTHEVVGILVDGAQDYERRGSCNVVNTLPEAQGDEGVTHASVAAAKMP